MARKAKDHLRLPLEWLRGIRLTTEEHIFEDVDAMRETYGAIGARLREISGNLGGRPRDPNKPRCPCGAMTAKRAAAVRHECGDAVKKPAAPASPALLPIAVGEYKTRQGHRAVVERTETAVRNAHGFSEFERNGKIYQQSRTWGMDSGKAILSHGRSGQAFDLVARN